MSQTLFNQPLNVINVGIAMFSDDLKAERSRDPARLDAAGPVATCRWLLHWTRLPIRRWQTKSLPLTSRRWNVLSSRIRC